MRISAIRMSDGVRPHTRQMETACEMIRENARIQGFVTDANVRKGSTIHVGIHSRSFRVNTAMLGHNARLGRATAGGYYFHEKSPKGYKRTDVPTWEQRKSFNHLVNDVLDKLNWSANVVSGNYTVRTRKGGRVNSWYPGGDRGSGGYSGDSAHDIVPESEARETCDSDRLEREHKENTRAHRLEAARQARERRKLFDGASRVTVSLCWYTERKEWGLRNGMRLTHAQFFERLAKLPEWARRRVKSATVKATSAHAQKLKLVQGGTA
jgi:hypothetical protein